MKCQRADSSLIHLDVGGVIVYVTVASVMQIMESINMTVSKNSRDVYGRLKEDGVGPMAGFTFTRRWIHKKHAIENKLTCL